MKRAGFLLALLFAAAGCGSGEAPAAKGQLTVFAGVPPVAYLAEKVGGGRVAVYALMNPGQNPHSFEPGPQQSTRLAGARLYFAVGLPIEEGWLPRLATAHPALEVVNVTGGAVPRSGPVLDPHVWTSPISAQRLALNMTRALCRADASGCADYRANYRTLSAELEQLHRELSHSLAPLKGAAFYVFHPAWGYFAKTYGLQQVALERHGKSPSAKHIAALIDAMEAADTRAIFVQPQLSARSARVVADAVGAEMVVLDPMQRDLPANLRHVANTLTHYLQPQ